MRKTILLTLIFSISPLFAFEKLSDDYLVTYGNSEASVRIIQYFSLTCPHCVALFRKQFQEIKERFIEKKLVSWVFHPVPMDLLTVQAMHCLKKLTPKEKRIFLEAMLEEVFIDNSKLSACLMQKAMEVLEHPIPDLQQKSYLSETEAFLDAFEFLKQEEKIEAVPAVEVNEVFLPGEIPDIPLIEDILFELGVDA